MEQWLNTQTNSEIQKQVQPHLFGLTLHGLGIFCLTKRKAEQNKKQNCHLFRLTTQSHFLLTQCHLALVPHEERFGLPCPEPGRPLQWSHTRSLLAPTGLHGSMTGDKGHPFPWGCRSPSLMFIPIFSCPYKPLLWSSTTPESAVCTSQDSAR